MRTSRFHAASISALGLVLALACSKGGDAEPAPQAVPAGGSAAGPAAPSDNAIRVQAKTIFNQRCVPCHGSTGAGDGPASAGLTPKPRAFGDGEWQKSVTDDHLVKIIRFGGAAVGKSPAMPTNPDVTEPVAVALKDLVRGFAPK